MLYTFGECGLDTQLHVLSRAGQFVKLRPKAFELLVYLLEHRDRIVPKHELCAQVWPNQFISDATWAVPCGRCGGPSGILGRPISSSGRSMGMAIVAWPQSRSARRRKRRRSRRRKGGESSRLPCWT